MTAALEGESGQQHTPAALYPGKDPVTIVQKVGCAAGLVWTGGKSRPHRDSIPDRPARSQSLYRLSYPGHRNNIIIVIIIIIIISSSSRSSSNSSSGGTDISRPSGKSSNSVTAGSVV